jgi:hypothetical protein
MGISADVVLPVQDPPAPERLQQAAIGMATMIFNI